MAFPRKLLADHEKIVLDLRPHWVALVVPALFTLLILAVVTAVYNLTESSWGENAIVIAGLVAWLILGLLPFLNWLFTSFVLTSDRLITRKGVVAKHSREIPLERINDVTFTQSVLDRMLGAGDLLVESAGERGQTRISNVRRPEQVQLTIYKETEANNNRMMRPGTGTNTTPQTPSPQAPRESVLEQIEALKRLKDGGALSEAEFETKKQELLKRL